MGFPILRPISTTQRKYGTRSWIDLGADILNDPLMTRCLLFLSSVSLLFPALANAENRKVIRITVDRGEDVGQAFGSLFEARSEDGTLVLGAGFQNAYNTRYRADRHELQFFVRPTDGKRDYEVTELPRPNDTLAGSYLFSQDGVVYSTYGGVKKWDPVTEVWLDATASGGGTNETMRVAHGVLKFGDTRVDFDDETILSPPEVGNYQLFFYANGHLCFYHVNRPDGPYKPWTDDSEGFSKLYACPWKPGDGKVDLSRATVMTLPIVGETTFAWGVLGDQIVTGSNVGGVYIYDDGAWRMIVEPLLGTSYQLYSSVIERDRLLMGHYPTGRLFAFDGSEMSDLPGSPPVPDGVSTGAREAQTTILYGGEVFTGVWPWGELWRFHPDNKRWVFQQRMFDHPELSAAITHPYDIENKGNDPGNLWGQRVTSLVTLGADLLVATSAKSPVEWKADRALWLAPDKWKSYGKIYRITLPGHLSSVAKWTEGPTTFEFGFGDQKLTIRQDGELIGEAAMDDKWQESLSFPRVLPGQGIHGEFRGKVIEIAE